MKIFSTVFLFTVLALTSNSVSSSEVSEQVCKTLFSEVIEAGNQLVDHVEKNSDQIKEISQISKKAFDKYTQTCL